MSEPGLCDFEYIDNAKTSRRWGACHYRCRHCGAWRPKPWSKACSSQPQSPPGAPYIIDYPNGKVLWGCRACDWTYEADNDEPIEHTCGSAQVVRLGDKLQSALEGIGITKERWQAAKQVLHLPPTCHCEARQEWLNKLDARLGIGENMNKLKTLLGWT
jgi:hypothetical protein